MKESKEPILIILVLFILVGLAYGPAKHSSQTKNSGTQNISSSVGEGPAYSPNKDVAEGIKKAEEEIKRLEQNAEKKMEEAKRSPYYGKVRMSSISGVYTNDPNEEYIYLYTNLNSNEILNITGWYLKSEVTGYYAMIGKVALLPFPFTHTESDIILSQEDRVVLSKGFSPIGISFRTNKCTGYFEENRNFSPSLSLECPLPRDEKLPKFSSDYDRNDECIDIIERMPRCVTYGTEFTRDLPDTVSESCKTYITTQINYNICVARHFGDTDFPGSEYRVFLNKFGPLWREKREKINLHDISGLIVDTISF